MDFLASSPPEDLLSPQRFLPNSAILVSRPSSSGSSLSSLSDFPNEPFIAETEETDTMAQSFEDVGELAAAGLVAQAVDQEVLEQEVAVKVPLHSRKKII
jgi:hypothetical protein